MTSTRPMRIAHVTPTFPPYAGGSGYVCFHHAVQLAARGHEVGIFTHDSSGSGSSSLAPRVSLHRLPALAAMGNAALLPSLVTRLRPYDVIHLHLPFIGSAELVATIASGTGKPLVATYHNDLTRSGTWRDIVFSVSNLLTRRFTLELCDRILFVSDGHAKTCDQRHAYLRHRDRCEIVRNGVDTTLFVPSAGDRREFGLAPTDRVVGFVSTLDAAHHYKGLDRLISAARWLGDPDLRVLIAGDGPMRRAYEATVRGLGLEGQVIFAGDLSHEKLARFYSACDAVVIPSKVPESFSLVAAEAQSAGVPVVASDGPGIRSVVRADTTGYLVAGDSPEALAHAIAALLSDASLRRRMGSAAREHAVAHLDWSAIGGHLESVYRDVLWTKVSA